MLSRVAAVLAMLAVFSPSATAADGGDARAVFSDAVAFWDMASPADQAGRGGSLEEMTPGATFGVRLEGPEREASLARGGDGRAARLRHASLSAGEGRGGALNVEGDRLTLLLRLKNTTEDWDLTLLGKHGGHDALQYNIYSFDRPGDEGAELGFEVYASGEHRGVRPLASNLRRNEWHTIVGRYDGEELDLFLNGRLIGTERASGPLRPGAGQPLVIGGEQVPGSDRVVRRFTGLIDHVAIWDRALSDEEVALVCPGHTYEPYEEPFRPAFHFTPPENWMNDPNGLLFADGVYHLFYQHNPYGDRWGHMSWGHATSPDLLHWEHRPIALMEEGRIQMWSGSAVNDVRNTSGLGRGGEGPLVAIYTQRDEGPPEHQTQAIAYSNDGGETWTKYHGNPVLDIGHHAFRDPKVFWYEPEGKWVMAVVIATDRVVQFYESSDLKSWTFMSAFGPEGAEDSGIWECPELFEVPVEGEPGATRWVLAVAVANAVSGATGAQYFVGEFDGRRFVNDNPPETALWVDRGSDFFALQSWNGIPESDGRRIWIGWAYTWRYGFDTPTSPWRGAMSVPREVGLARTDEGVRLTQRPIGELERLRGDGVRLAGVVADAERDPLDDLDLRGKAWDIEVTFKIDTARRFGVRVLEGPGEHTEIGYDHRLDEMYLNRRRSGNTEFARDFIDHLWAPVDPGEDERVSMRILVDHSIVEVFSGDGTAVLTGRVFPGASSEGLSLFTDGGEVLVESIEAYPIDTVWDGGAAGSSGRARSAPKEHQKP